LFNYILKKKEGQRDNISDLKYIHLFYSTEMGEKRIAKFLNPKIYMFKYNRMLEEISISKSQNWKSKTDIGI
jgi:hypothetical protein